MGVRSPGFLSDRSAAAGRGWMDQSQQIAEWRKWLSHRVWGTALYGCPKEMSKTEKLKYSEIRKTVYTTYNVRYSYP